MSTTGPYVPVYCPECSRELTFFPGSRDYNGVELQPHPPGTLCARCAAKTRRCPVCSAPAGTNCTRDKAIPPIAARWAIHPERGRAQLSPQE